jgi:Protein of unknown function (DUF2848)
VPRLTLIEHSREAARQHEIIIDSLIIAGWTGRDAAAVQAHIHELEEIGVAPPPRTPMFYRVAAGNLTTAPVIEVAGQTSSGEAEVVLVSASAGLWVGLGSDHTDRSLEKQCVTLSKQVCAKPLATSVWPLIEVADHWDALELSSSVSFDGQEALYQQGSVAALCNPLDLAEAYCGNRQLPRGTAMYCGTLPAKGGVRFADRMVLELRDPVLGRTLRHSYAITPLPVE